MHYEVISSDAVSTRHLAEAALAIAGKELGGFLGRPQIKWVKPRKGMASSSDGLLEGHDGMLGMVDASDPSVIVLRGDLPPRDLVETTFHEAYHVYRHERLGHLSREYVRALDLSEEIAAEAFALRGRSDVEALLRLAVSPAPEARPTPPGADLRQLEAAVLRDVIAAEAERLRSPHVHRQSSKSSETLAHQGPLEIQRDEKDPDKITVRGYASVFGTLIDCHPPTIIHKGAFAKTLNEHRADVRVLWMHEFDEPVAIPGLMAEDERGLKVEFQLSAKVVGAQNFEKVRLGIIDALSIGFDPVRFDFEEREGGMLVRHLRELRLWEFSLVTWGANRDARITSVQGANQHGRGTSVDTALAGFYGVEDFQDIHDAD